MFLNFCAEHDKLYENPKKILTDVINPTINRVALVRNDYSYIIVSQINIVFFENLYVNKIHFPQNLR